MFTLIIPYYNRAKFLPRVLRSILHSSIKPEFIILVDNASTDQSFEICKEFSLSHPELSIRLLSEQHKGASYARNMGLSQVTTEWVYFFDSDDELSSNYFATVRKIISTNEDVDVVCCATKMMFADGKEVVRKVQYSSSPVDQILSGQLTTQGMFFKTSFLRRIGGWNHTLTTWDDWELGVRVLLHEAKIIWIKDQAFHHLYQHSESLTGESFSSTYLGIRRALDTVYILVRTNETLILALIFRCIILSALLHREKDLIHSQELRRAALLFDKHRNLLTRIMLDLLYFYVCKGGKGAWWIALRFLRSKKTYR